MTDLHPDMDLRAERAVPLRTVRSEKKASQERTLPGQKTLRRYQSGEVTLTKLIWRKLAVSPGRAFTTLAAAGVGLAIFTNLMLLQPETHKSPLFVGNPRIHATPIVSDAPVPMQRPAQLERDAEAVRRAALLKDIQTELASRGFFIGDADGQSSPRLAQAIRDFQQAANQAVNGQATDSLLAAILTSNVRPKDQIVATLRAGTDRMERAETVVAVQRALTKLGFANLRDDGNFGPSTRAALDRFEQARKLPPRGDQPQRVLKELEQASGIAIP